MSHVPLSEDPAVPPPASSKSMSFDTPSSSSSTSVLLNNTACILGSGPVASNGTQVNTRYDPVQSHIAISSDVSLHADSHVDLNMLKTDNQQSVLSVVPTAEVQNLLLNNKEIDEEGEILNKQIRSALHDAHFQHFIATVQGAKHMHQWIDYYESMDSDGRESGSMNMNSRGISMGMRTGIVTIKHMCASCLRCTCLQLYTCVRCVFRFLLCILFLYLAIVIRYLLYFYGL